MTDRQTSQRWFNFFARTSCFGMPPKEQKPVGDLIDVNTVKVAPTKALGRSFLASYMLLNGCHACARLATVWFQFDFDSTGKYVGIRYQKLDLLSAVQ